MSSRRETAAGSPWKDGYSRDRPCRRSTTALLLILKILFWHEGHGDIQTGAWNGGVLEDSALRIPLPSLCPWRAFAVHIVSPTRLPELAPAPARVPFRAAAPDAPSRRTKPE